MTKIIKIIDKESKVDSASTDNPTLNQDHHLFVAAMRDVIPLHHTKIVPQPKKTPLPRPKRSFKNRPTTAAILPFLFSDYEKLPLVGAEEPLHYARSGIANKTLRKLRNGQYNTEALLDLHGKTVAEAREALAYFLFHCQQENIQHAIVIHGKGLREKPLLKNRLNHWLRQTDLVLAFCTARPWDGGQGALYILLGRRCLDR